MLTIAIRKNSWTKPNHRFPSLGPHIEALRQKIKTSMEGAYVTWDVHPLTKTELLLIHTLEVCSGVFSGLLVAGLLSPWDRGLYLSIKERRSFLDRQNFIRPFQGITQSLFQRSLSHGLYFPLEKYFLSLFQNLFGECSNLSNLSGGLFAGAVNAVIMNPIAATKYTFWGNDNNRSLLLEIKTMYKQGGLMQFRKGMFATVSRDVTFGATFALLRHRHKTAAYNSEHTIDDGRSNHCDCELNGTKCFHKNNQCMSDRLWIDCKSAFAACLLSSPMNYVRNMQYATPKHSGTIPKPGVILQLLYREGLTHPSLLHSCMFWCSRLRIGWGTMRVAIGMTLTSLCWELSQYLIGLETRNSQLLNHRSTHLSSSSSSSSTPPSSKLIIDQLLIDKNAV